MDDSREGSPDWLRCFQIGQVIGLLDRTRESSRRCAILDSHILREANGVDESFTKAPKQSILTLSSDSDPSPNNSPIREDDIHDKKPAVHKTSQLPMGGGNQDTVHIDSAGESPVSKAPKSKSPKTKVKEESRKIEGNGVKVEAAKDETLEKHIESHVSSRLPLMISEKVHRSKALIECEGESIDMSGDVGAVGRIVISDTRSGDHDMLLDLKGTIYKTTIVPSRTFCIVSFGQAEAKIEAVMNDFIQLKPQSNVYEAETMIEGTLDGFSFDSEEEKDKTSKPSARQSDQNNEAEELANGKTNGKAEKSLGVIRKKSKTVGKLPKKGRKKTQGSKKAKNAKK